MKNTTSDSDNYLLGVEKTSLRRYQLFDEIYQPATEARFATLPVTRDMKILEIGCGIGQTACYMARAIVPEGHVVAFDQSEALIGLAKRYAADNAIDNVTFLCEKAQEYEYDTESFDLVHTRYVLTYSPYAADIVKHCYRALKDAGIFFGEEVSQEYVKHRQPQWFDDVTAWFKKLIEIGGGNPNYGLDKLPSDMLDAGFQDLSITAHTPVRDQAKIIEMLRLSLSKEMKEYLIDNDIASASEIDADVAAMGQQPKDSLISSSTVYQVTGVRL